jgi:hypothetical protein
MMPSMGMVMAYLRWIVSPWITWLTLVLLLGAGVAAFWPPVTERHVRLAGVGLQLCGTAAGLLAWASTRRRFKVQSLAECVREWWRARPQRNIIMPLSGAAISVSMGSAQMSVWSNMGSGLDTAKRLDAMAANIEQLRKEAQELDARHTAAEAKLHDDFEAKTRATQGALSDVDRQLRGSQTEGLWLALSALIMLIIGMALAGAAPEIACIAGGI